MTQMENRNSHHLKSHFIKMHKIKRKTHNKNDHTLTRKHVSVLVGLVLDCGNVVVSRCGLINNHKTDSPFKAGKSTASSIFQNGRKMKFHYY